MSVNNSSYDKFAEFSNTSLSSGAKSGTSGSDMAVWGLGRNAKLSRFSGANLVNNSQYDIGPGVLDGNDSYGESPLDNELSLSENVNIVPGDTGSTMSVWLEDRGVRLRRFSGGEYTSNAQFNVGPGILDGSDEYDESPVDNEFGHGTTISANFFDASANPLSGSYVIDSSTGVLESGNTTGQLSVAARPPLPVKEGSDLDVTTSFSLEYEPDAKGIGYSEDFGIEGLSTSVQYGEVDIEVKDVDGNKLSGESIIVEDEDTIIKTSDGVTALSAPGGQYNLTGLKNSVTKSVDIPSGGSISEQFQYGGVILSVTLPNGEGLGGLLVTGEGTLPVKNTDDTGSVRYTRVPPGVTVGFTISNSIEESIQLGDEGIEGSLNVTLGWGVSGSVYDVDGKPIRNVPVESDVENTVSGTTDSSGRFSLGGLSPGTVEVILAVEDNRYQATRATVEVEDGDIVALTEQLEEKEQIGTR